MSAIHNRLPVLAVEIRAAHDGVRRGAAANDAGARMADLDAVLRWRVGDTFKEKAGSFVHNYRLAAIKPHTNKNGTASALLYWSGICVICGAGLVALSGRRPRDLLRTCARHRGQWTGRKAGGTANG